MATAHTFHYRRHPNCPRRSLQPGFHTPQPSPVTGDFAPPIDPRDSGFLIAAAGFTTLPQTPEKLPLATTFTPTSMLTGVNISRPVYARQVALDAQSLNRTLFTFLYRLHVWALHSAREGFPEDGRAQQERDSGGYNVEKTPVFGVLPIRGRRRGRRAANRPGNIVSLRGVLEWGLQ